MPPLRFTPSDATTVGIELELQLVDARTRDLRPAVAPVMSHLLEHHPEATQRVHRELFTNTLELVTGVAPDVATAVRDLQTSMEWIRASIDELGLGVRLMSSGTHPFARWRAQEVTADDRISRLIEQLQQPIRRLLTFGLHVHVGVASSDHAIRAVDLLNRHLPLFIALSASSPFWNGADTGYASYRGPVFETLPLTGLAPDARSWDEYEAMYDSYVRAGWCSSHKDLHWDVRPSPSFGTVEMRACDAVPRIGDVAALAALAQCVATGGEEHAVVAPLPRHLLEMNKWQAQRYALEGRVMVARDGETASVRDLTAALLERIDGAAGRLGCGEMLAGVHILLDGGVSSVRQRRARDASTRRSGDGTGGPEDPRIIDVVDSLCDELELTLDEGVSSR